MKKQMIVEITLRVLGDETGMITQVEVSSSGVMRPYIEEYTTRMRRHHKETFLEVKHLTKNVH